MSGSYEQKLRELYAQINELDQKRDILSWIKANKIVTESGQEYGLEGHEFQRDLLLDNRPLQAVMKCSQVGISLIFTYKSIYTIKRNKLNLIYTLPTMQNDVQKFVPSKVDPIVAKNKIKLLRDTLSQKQFDEGFWFFASTFGEKEGIMITGDVLVHDELDRSNLDVVETFKSRLGHSKFRWRWYFSNPSYPSDSPDRPNINYYWNRSDQKHWFVKCDCGQGNFGGWQYLNWPDSFDLERKVYRCLHCGKEITAQHVSDGRWVAKYPSRNSNNDPSGYWISRMCAPWISAADIIQEQEEAKTEAYFYNFILGLPYLASDVKIDRSLVLQNVTETAPSGGIAMGVDVGERLHVVIGDAKGVISVSECDWESLDTFVKSYDPRQIVIDAMPEITKAKEFQKRWYGRVLRCYYREEKLGKPAQQETYNIDHKEGVIQAWRTECIDLLIDDLANHNVLFYASPKLNLTEGRRGQSYCDHWESIYLVKDEDTEVRRWEHSGADHFMHATVYYWLARQTMGPESLNRILRQ